MSEGHDHGWMRPVDARLALALLLTLSGGGYAVMRGSHESEAMTVQQSQQLGAMRTQIEQADQRCNELRIRDLRDDMRKPQP